VTDLPITSLPVPSGGRTLTAVGSPVLDALPDWRILYNAAGSGSVRVSESGVHRHRAAASLHARDPRRHRAAPCRCHPWHSSW